MGTLIKKFELYKESLLNKLEGPNDEELLNNLKSLQPYDMFLKSIKLNFQPGIDYAVNTYGYRKEYKYYLKISEQFKSKIDKCERMTFDNPPTLSKNIYYVLNNKIFMSLETGLSRDGYFGLIEYDFIEKIIKKYEFTWDELSKIFEGIISKYLGIVCSYVSFINTENYKEWTYIEDHLSYNTNESLLNKLDESKYNDNLKQVNPEKFIFHKSNPIFREQISKTGLIPKGKSEAWLSNTPIDGEVIFASNSSKEEDWFDSTYDDDIYQIDTTDLNNTWYYDPNFDWMHDDNKYIITFESIPLSNIKLIYKGTGEDKL